MHLNSLEHFSLEHFANTMTNIRPNPISLLFSATPDPNKQSGPAMNRLKVTHKKIILDDENALRVTTVPLRVAVPGWSRTTKENIYTTVYDCGADATLTGMRQWFLLPRGPDVSFKHSKYWPPCKCLLFNMMLVQCWPNVYDSYDVGPTLNRHSVKSSPVR